MADYSIYDLGFNKELDKINPVTSDEQKSQVDLQPVLNDLGGTSSVGNFVGGIVDVNNSPATIKNLYDIDATATEINVLSGITATTDELNYTDGVTSNIQTQLDGKVGALSITAGETIDGSTTPQVVYLKGSDGKVYKADADFEDERSQVLGFTASNVTSGQTASVITQGEITVPTISLTESISEATDFPGGELFANDNTLITISALSYRISAVFMIGDQVSKLSAIGFNFMPGTGTATGKVELYAATSVGKPTGSALATTNTVSVATGITKFTFATSYSVTPGSVYAAVFVPVGGTGQLVAGHNSTSGRGGYNLVRAGFQDGYPINTYQSLDSGSTWTSPGTTIAILTTYFDERVYRYGDDIYLSATAGEYTKSKSFSVLCNYPPIATILTQTKLKIGKPPSVYLGTTGLDYFVHSPATRYNLIQAPPRARKAIIQTVCGGEATQSTIYAMMYPSSATIGLAASLGTWAWGNTSYLTFTPGSAPTSVLVHFYTN